MTLPSWKAADTVYRKAHRILESMRARGHATAAVKTKRGKVKTPGTVSQAMRDLIAALDSGDEETIKGLLLNTAVYYEDNPAYNPTPAGDPPVVNRAILVGNHVWPSTDEACRRLGVKVGPDGPLTALVQWGQSQRPYPVPVQYVVIE